MTPTRPAPARARRRASVLVIVLVGIVFTAVALTAFIEKAGNDLLVETREADAARLRLEAYSALETTLAVLEEFREVNGGLRSPAEGWDDPLGFADYAPGDGRRVSVAFEDESGRLSLPAVDRATLVTLFESWEILRSDAERLADALLGWMHADHVPAAAGAPRPEDYERGDVPYGPPGRSLRSFAELAAIAVVNEMFFDEDGRLNGYGRRFQETFSLFRYTQPNVNAAGPGTLAALGQSDPFLHERLSEYRRGKGAFARQGPGYFKAVADAAAVLGPQARLDGFGTEIRALRVRVTVEQGTARYELNAVVSPPGGATLVTTPAARSGKQGRPSAADAVPPPAAPAAASPAGAEARSRDDAGGRLNYPFTLLEFTERVQWVPAAPAETDL
jgi:general secretion pathway protein K